ncbi:hypothetical protein BDZ88DRAFT_412786 [Geranomyces variabilis]|nr:hypothetical protein BDZ88DRAFT_412786 [Geranomyces variabilis]
MEVYCRRHIHKGAEDKVKGKGCTRQKKHKSQENREGIISSPLEKRSSILVTLLDTHGPPLHPRNKITPASKPNCKVRDIRVLDAVKLGIDERPVLGLVGRVQVAVDIDNLRGHVRRGRRVAADSKRCVLGFGDLDDDALDFFEGDADEVAEVALLLDGGWVVGSRVDGRRGEKVIGVKFGKSRRRVLFQMTAVVDNGQHQFVVSLSRVLKDNVGVLTKLKVEPRAVEVGLGRRRTDLHVGRHVARHVTRGDRGGRGHGQRRDQRR